MNSFEELKERIHAPTLSRANVDRPELVQVDRWDSSSKTFLPFLHVACLSITLRS